MSRGGRVEIFRDIRISYLRLSLTHGMNQLCHTALQITVVSCVYDFFKHNLRNNNHLDFQRMSIEGLCFK